MKPIINSICAEEKAYEGKHIRVTRIMAFIMAAIMVFGDVTPVFAAELPTYEDSGNVIPEESASVEESGLEESSETESESTTEPEESSEEESTEEPTRGSVEGAEEESTEESVEESEEEYIEESEIDPSEEETDPEEDFFPEDAEIQYMEVDASEYILQAGGDGVLPEAEDEGGIALFSLQEDRAEAALVAGFKERKTLIDLSSYGLTATALRNVYARALNNNPSLFYVEASWYYYITPDGLVSSVIPSYVAKYNDASIKKYEAAVQKALACINDNMTDVEKALALHDYLATFCAYDLTYQRYDAYNALVEGSAVCQGYTLAYTDLMQRAGINCSYATSNSMNCGE